MILFFFRNQYNIDANIYLYACVFYPVKAGYLLINSKSWKKGI